LPVPRGRFRARQIEPAARRVQGSPSVLAKYLLALREFGNVRPAPAAGGRSKTVLRCIAVLHEITVYGSRYHVSSSPTKVRKNCPAENYPHNIAPQLGSNRDRVYSQKWQANRITQDYPWTSGSSDKTRFLRCLVIRLSSSRHIMVSCRQGTAKATSPYDASRSVSLQTRLRRLDAFYEGFIDRSMAVCISCARRLHEDFVHDACAGESGRIRSRF
jgi:hypothetical protein